MLLAVLYASFRDGLDFLHILELKTLDLRFKLRGVGQPSEDVVIVVIDDYSIENLGRWPWPRSYHAKAVDILSDAGARAIGFDMIFTEPEENPARYVLRQLKHYYESLGLNNSPEGVKFSGTLRQAIETSDSDLIFSESVRKSGNVAIPFVLISFDDNEQPAVSEKEYLPQEDMPPPELFGTDPTVLEPPDRIKAAAYSRPVKDDGNGFDVTVARDLLMPIPELLERARMFGYVNFSPDIDGSLRWQDMAYELSGEYYGPIEVQLVKEYLGLEDTDLRLIRGEGLQIGKTTVPLDRKARFLINFYGPLGSFKYYSFADLIDGTLESEAFSEKIVLIGGAATGLGDVWTTPFEKSMPGVEKNATVISNILKEDFLIKSPPLVDVIFILAVGLVLGFILPKTSSVRGVAFSLLALAVTVVLNFSLFSFFRMWANLVWPLTTLFSVSACVITYQFFTEEKEKRHIKKAFKYYLNPALVDELAKDHSGLQLGGEEKELTVLFSDIRGFTSISEGMSPERLVSFMNTYLSLMTKTIMQNNGVVDKYIGDAVMAIFGAPLYFEDHAETACSTAVRMIEEIRSCSKAWQEMGFPEINIGIGINTGPMVVGNMGSEDRFDYTVMGDSVNLASRLEGLCKVYGAGIVVSEFTASKADGFSFRELDVVQVKGKEYPERIFELLVEADKEDLKEYTEALKLYRQRQWTQALESFSHLLLKTGHPLYRLYEQRCLDFQKTPPPDDWDGVFRLTEK